jgi:hypothetical protein
VVLNDPEVGQILIDPGDGSSAEAEFILRFQPPGPVAPTASAAPPEAVSVDLWKRADLSREGWPRVMSDLQAGRQRLTPPPRHFHELEAFLSLRALLLESATTRRTFLAVRWRGRPNGIVFLARLLAEGMYVPEVETDGEYLEAELGHLQKGNAEYRSPEGRWALGPGWTVIREMDSSGPIYRAEYAAPAA